MADFSKQQHISAEYSDEEESVGEDATFEVRSDHGESSASFLQGRAYN